LRAALALLPLLVLGCGPTYPNCNNDEDCNKEKPRGEFCVNQKCQQCRDNKDCAAGKRCNKGRCDEIPGYCEDDRQCAPEETCQNHKCTTCKSDDQCGEGGKCKQGKCIRQGRCQVDDDCPEGQDCKNGVCTGPIGKKADQNAACKLTAIFFDFNEAALSTEAADTLDKNAGCIKKVGRGVNLIGRSDSRGTEEYNIALSERRAQAVKEQLIRLGSDSSKLRTQPRGELDATGKDEQGWAQDRRVDFEWQ
jgi:peptidoglycan-associated lipoprotein